MKVFTSFHCLKVKVQVSDVLAAFVRDFAPDTSGVRRQNHEQTWLVRLAVPRRREGSCQMKVFTCFLSLAHEFGNVRLSDAVATEEATGHICHFNGQLSLQWSVVWECLLHMSCVAIVAQSRQESISACQRSGRSSISQ